MDKTAVIGRLLVRILAFRIRKECGWAATAGGTVSRTCQHKWRRGVGAILLLTMLAVPLPILAASLSVRGCARRTPLESDELEGRFTSAPRAAWVIAENLRSGTTGWCIPHSAPRHIEGYADRVSARNEDVVAMFVSAGAPRFRVEAYRLGFYQGLGGRLIWTSGDVTARPQPRKTRDRRTNMVVAGWHLSLRFQITHEWPPGSYLLKMVGTDRSQGYVPLVVRDDGSHAALLIQHSVVTWQAYNDWGGYNLYQGLGDKPGERIRPRPDRARVVSFDRPYSEERGAGLMADEQVLVSLVERLGLDVSYWTDIDLDERPSLLLNHRALILPGHDEYWSTGMFDGALAARGHGVNIALLAANSIYRHVRLVPSSLGSDRKVIGYKDKDEDPMWKKDPAEATVEFRGMPMPRPESLLNGALYECNPVKADLVVLEGGNWLFDRTGLRSGEHLQNLVRYEYDRVNPRFPTPSTIQVLAHSPVLCWGHSSYADMTYYTSRSGAGVFDASTTAWLTDLSLDCALGRHCGRVSSVIEQMTENLLAVFAHGPAGIDHPSRSNIESLGLFLPHPFSP